jgi:hypothetical protein
VGQQGVEHATGMEQPVPASAASADGPLATAAGAQHSLRILMLGHELSSTGAPQSLLEIALHLRSRGHSVSFLLLRGGPLEPTLKRAGFQYSFTADVQARLLCVAGHVRTSFHVFWHLPSAQG